MQQVDDFAHVMETFKRFAVATKDELVDDGEIVLVENAHDAVDARFAAFKPERVAFHHFLCLAQAKNATARAAVCHVHVNVLAGDVAAVGDVEVACLSNVSSYSINNHLILHQVTKIHLEAQSPMRGNVVVFAVADALCYKFCGLFD